MSDAVTPEDRSLIDSAVRDGRVTVVPQGTSGLEGADFSWKARPFNFKRPGKKPDPQVAARRQEVRDLASTMTVAEIAKKLGVSDAVVRLDLTNLGVKAKRAYARSRSKTTLSEKKRERADAKRESVKRSRDRRRFKSTPVPTGDQSRLAPAHATGTLFRKQVLDPAPDQTLLKDGANNSKIGGDVLVGWLKGAKIFTLTLEERATCPASCTHWRSCYGNGMQHAQRWRHGPALEALLAAQVGDLCERHERVLIRLHVLGDFYSSAYVAHWGALLDQYPGLYIFGFTARAPGTEIGDAIIDLMTEFEGRVFMRFSGQCSEWGSFTVDFPTERKRIGTAIVCPEQRDAMNSGAAQRHCGSCGVCWSTSAPVAFVEH